jgi:acetone carboxylase gamma subunit
MRKPPPAEARGGVAVRAVWDRGAEGGATRVWSVEEERPHEVPSLDEVWPQGDESSPWVMQNVCPRCGQMHVVHELLETQGPLAREFFCPSGGGPLMRVERAGDGWTWWADPEWAIGLQPPRF